MKFSIWQQKIPTVFGLLAIVVGIFVTSYLSQNTTIFKGNASSSEEPKNVRVTNVTDSSFTVTYITDGYVIGSVIYGSEKTTALDDRDRQNNVLPRTIHVITVKNLQPSTNYTFSILSGQTTFSQQNNGNDTSFEVKTGTPISAPADDITTGTLLLPDTSPAKDTIVYLKSDLSQTLSVITSSDGTYAFNLAQLRSSDLSNYLDVKNQILNIFATSGQYSSNISFLKSQKIPTITLSNDYDFTLSQTPIASFSAALGFPSMIATPSANGPSISRPKDGEEFTDQRPQFRGTALPGSTVEITVHSDSQTTTQIVADSLGNWTYRPTSPLDPGQHTITIQTKDQFGILRKISQSFTVFAEGTQVDQSATPSATLAPTVPPPTPTNIILPTVTPTPIILPTRPAPPQSGDGSAIQGTLGGIAMSLLGLILIVITRGRISL